MVTHCCAPGKEPSMIETQKFVSPLLWFQFNRRSMSCTTKAGYRGGVWTHHPPKGGGADTPPPAQKNNPAQSAKHIKILGTWKKTKIAFCTVFPLKNRSKHTPKFSSSSPAQGAKRQRKNFGSWVPEGGSGPPSQTGTVIHSPPPANQLSLNALHKEGSPASHFYIDISRRELVGVWTLHRVRSGRSHYSSR